MSEIGPKGRALPVIAHPGHEQRIAGDAREGSGLAEESPHDELIGRQRIESGDYAQAIREAPSAPMPIIVGVPRSGTTLLRFMLDAHPELAIPPETGFLAVLDVAGGPRDATTLLELITRYPPDLPAFADFGVDARELHDQWTRLVPFDLRAAVRGFYRAYAHRHGKTRWGDKTPSYLASMHAIRELLPEARFVHLIRDGRDVAVSLRRQWFAPSREIAALAEFWRRQILAARVAESADVAVLEVRYEELVRLPEPVLKRICSFVELEYTPAMLEYPVSAPQRLQEHRGRIGPDGSVLLTAAQRHAQQRNSVRAPDPSLIGSWRSALTLAEQDTFHRIAGDLLDELGYQGDGQSGGGGERTPP